MKNKYTLKLDGVEGKLEKFVISKGINGEFQPETVEGKRITIAGIECFIFVEEYYEEWGRHEEYNISHLGTGFKVCSELSTVSEISTAERSIELGWAKAHKKCLQACKVYGIKLPVNK